MTIEDKIKLSMSKILKVDSEDALSVKYGEHYSWDSLTHVLLIADLEQSFEIKFAAEDIINMLDFNQIKEVLLKYGK